LNSIPGTHIALSRIQFLAEAILLMHCDPAEMQLAIGLIAELAQRQIERNQQETRQKLH